MVGGAPVAGIDATIERFKYTPDNLFPAKQRTDAS
jgi:hypothetical protein